MDHAPVAGGRAGAPDRRARGRGWSCPALLPLTIGVAYLATTAVLAAVRSERWPLGDLAAYNLQWAASVAKWMAIAAVFLEVWRVRRALVAGRLTAVRVAATWSIALVGVVVLLAAVRQPLAGWVDSDTTHFTTCTFAGYDHPWDHGERDEHRTWVLAWDRGWFVVLESVLVAAIAALAALLLSRPSERWDTRVVAGVGVLVAGLCILSTWAFGLVRSSYDLFHDGILIGSLSFELALPLMAWHPESAISAVALVALLASCRWLSREPAR